MQLVRERGTGHGPSTVAEALAASGDLVNKLDRRGYRLPDWPKPSRTPSLFDGPPLGRPRTTAKPVRGLRDENSPRSWRAVGPCSVCRRHASTGDLP
jgi:hypothetical protein